MPTDLWVFHLATSMPLGSGHHPRVPASELLEAALLQGQGGVPQPLDGALEALLLLVQVQEAAGA